MKQTISRNQFIRAFETSDRANNFSYDGLNTIFDMLEEYEDCTGEEIDFDLIAICCDYSEYKNFEEVQKDYPNILDLDMLRDNTNVWEFETGLIVQMF